MTNLNSLKKIGFLTAITLVVANMVGTGVFTSLGFQLFSLNSVFPLLMLWVVGGIIALSGALSYGELAGMMPRSGGEYNFLSKIYHPGFGFLAGWGSATIGFPAAIAAASLALGKYTSSVLGGANGDAMTIIIAIVVLLLVTAVHSYDVGVGGSFQKVTTGIKVVLIVGLIFGGFFITSEPQSITILPQSGDLNLLFSAGFATSLAFVSFSYSGWNAAAYMAGEIKNPQRTVPRALIIGTLIVTVTYFLLNLVFLYSTPMNAMKGQEEVGYVAANYIFGSSGGKVMGTLIALLLISSISSMVFAGPRVTQVMGEDTKLLGFLAYRNKKGIPLLAIVFQTFISIVLILTASFEQIILGIAFTLDIFTFSTVLGVFVMRIKKPNAERPYKTLLYPITPLIFLLGTGWTMGFLLYKQTLACVIGLSIVLIGLVLYLVDQSLNNKRTQV